MKGTKITTETIIISILWVAAVVSYLVTQSVDLSYVLGIAGLFIVTILLVKMREAGMLMLMLLLLLATFNLVRFSIAFNLFVYLFNVLPLVLLVILIIRRKSTLVRLWNNL